MCRLQAIGGTMRLPPDKVCRLIRKLYASTSSPSIAGQTQNYAFATLGLAGAP